ncbi:MAG: hypothetical protein GY856_48305, partial [bacterium]|nr:hypothetical protein [bacterium]
MLKYELSPGNPDTHPWRQILWWCDGGATAIEPLDPWSTWYAAMQFNSIYKTESAGTDWVPDPPPSIFSGGAEFVGAFALCPQSTSAAQRVLIAEKGARLYRSDNGGDTWSYSTVSPANNITAVAFGEPTTNACDTYFVGIENGEIWRTTNGASWVKIYQPSGDAAAVLDFAVDPSNPNVLYASYGGLYELPPYSLPPLAVHPNLIKSDDALAATPGWQDVDYGTFEKNPVNAVLVEEYNPQIVYAGTDLGVFRSADGAATWELFMNGHPRVPVHDLIAHSGEVLSFTHGRSAFRLNIVHQPPVAEPDRMELADCSTPVTIPYSTVLANDSDPDDDPLTICASTDLTQHGSLDWQPQNERWIYTPASTFCDFGADSFTYTINDRSDCSGRSDEAAVMLTGDLAGEVIFEDLFESGPPPAWSGSYVPAGGSVEVDESAALSGQYGLAVTVDAATTYAYLIDDSPELENHYNVSFLLDPNSIAMADGSVHQIFLGRGGGLNQLRVNLRWQSGSYKLAIGTWLDDRTFVWAS